MEGRQERSKLASRLRLRLRLASAGPAYTSKSRILTSRKVKNKKRPNKQEHHAETQDGKNGMEGLSPLLCLASS